MYNEISSIQTIQKQNNVSVFHERRSTFNTNVTKFLQFGQFKKKLKYYIKEE